MHELPRGFSVYTFIWKCERHKVGEKARNVGFCQIL